MALIYTKQESSSGTTTYSLRKVLASQVWGRHGHRDQMFDFFLIGGGVSVCRKICDLEREDKQACKSSMSFKKTSYCDICTIMMDTYFTYRKSGPGVP